MRTHLSLTTEGAVSQKMELFPRDWLWRQCKSSIIENLGVLVDVNELFLAERKEKS